jgi:type I restriction enzyme, S subunit
VPVEIIGNKNIVHPLKDNLLMSRANTRELVGATCVVDDNYTHLFLSDKLWRINLNSNLCRTWYLKYLLSNERFRPRLTETATGTSGSMLNISQDKLKQLRIPLPPIELQNKFETILEVSQNKHKDFTKAILQSDTLFHSLQHRAFRGEL